MFDYKKALAESDAAFWRFNAIRAEYRAGNVDDDTFLTARAEYEEAKEAFDLAFALEAA